jgi:hypothetical protein
MWVAEQELLNRKQEASPAARPHQKTPRRTERRTKIRLAKIVNEGLELGKGSTSQEEHTTSGAPAHGDERGACLKRAWPRNPGDEEIDTEEISKKKKKKTNALAQACERTAMSTAVPDHRRQGKQLGTAAYSARKQNLGENQNWSMPIAVPESRSSRTKENRLERAWTAPALTAKRKTEFDWEADPAEQWPISRKMIRGQANLVKTGRTAQSIISSTD